MAPQEERDEAARQEKTAQKEEVVLKKEIDIDTKEKYAEIMRALWRHENDLMNARFGWFTTIQGLLFTALGFAWQSRATDNAVILIIACLGSIVALMTILILKIGFRAGVLLSEHWIRLVEPYDGPPMTGKPRIKSADNEPETYFITEWEIIPYAFLVAWLIIVAIH